MVHSVDALATLIYIRYTGWFRRKGQYFGRWEHQSLWETNTHINMCL